MESFCDNALFSLVKMRHAIRSARFIIITKCFGYSTFTHIYESMYCLLLAIQRTTKTEEMKMREILKLCAVCALKCVRSRDRIHKFVVSVTIDIFSSVNSIYISLCSTECFAMNPANQQSSSTINKCITIITRMYGIN